MGIIFLHEFTSRLSLRNWISYLLFLSTICISTTGCHLEQITTPLTRRSQIAFNYISQFFHFVECWHFGATMFIIKYAKLLACNTASWYISITSNFIIINPLYDNGYCLHMSTTSAILPMKYVPTYLETVKRPWRPGGRLNKKDGLTRYGDSHVKDKTS